MWVPFDDLSMDSRIWQFQSDKLLSQYVRKDIDQEMNSFIDQWSTHGKQMHGSHTILHNCFVIVAADEQRELASGCSIDSFTALFKEFGHRYQLSFFDRFSIACKTNNDVRLMKLNRFKGALDSGEITGDSTVFNHLISSKADLSSSWEIAVKDSWLKRYL